MYCVVNYLIILIYCTKSYPLWVITVQYVLYCAGLWAVIPPHNYTFM